MWSLVADLYTPVLAGAVIWLTWRGGVGKTSLKILLVSLGLVLAFSILERHWELWHSWGLDYSTHTAILLPFYQLLLVFSLMPLRQDTPVEPAERPWLIFIRRAILLIFALLSGIAYAALMIRLGYHTLADILTTLLSSYPLVWICFHLMDSLFVIHRRRLS